MENQPLLERMLDPVLGPRPASVVTVPAGLSRARAAVLELLNEGGSAISVAELAADAELHPNTAREHLDGLVEAGLATRSRARPTGRGRPAWLYRAAPPGRDTAGTEYAGLARALVEQIARSSPDPRADALQAGRRWGAELARRRAAVDRDMARDRRAPGDHGAAGRPGTDRGPGPAGAREPATGPGSAPDHDPSTARRTAAAGRAVAVDLLADLRFDPLPNGNATAVRLRTCPILDAAREHPEIVCGVHLGIVGGALDELGGPAGQRIDLVPFAEPGACLLTIRP